MNMQSNDMSELLEATSQVDPGVIAEQLLNEIEMGAAEIETADDLDALAEIEQQSLSSEAGKDDDGDLGIDRASLYEQQDNNLVVGSSEDQAPVDNVVTQEAVESKNDADPQELFGEPTKPTRKARGTPGADPNPTTPSGMLKKQADVNGLKQLGFDDEGVDALMSTIDGAPKKVAEKAKNLLRYALGREHVSAVTKFALSKLRDMPAGFTTVDLVAMLQAERSYSPGTARSQAQQMSRLFGMFDMIAKDGKTMTLQGENSLSKAVLSRLNGDPFIAEPSSEPEMEAEEPTTGGVEVDAAPVEEPAAEVEAPSPAPKTTKAATRRSRKKGQVKLAA